MPFDGDVEGMISTYRAFSDQRCVPVTHRVGGFPFLHVYFPYRLLTDDVQGRSTSMMVLITRQASEDMAALSVY